MNAPLRPRAFLPALALALGTACHDKPVPITAVEMPAIVSTAPSHSGARAIPAPPGRSERPTFGDASAPVHIVYFIDPQCPHCLHAHEAVSSVVHSMPKTVFVEWKFYPLPGHPDARVTSLYAEGVFALAGFDAFERFTTAAMHHMQELTPENLDSWAKEAGVTDVQALRAGVQGHRWDAILETEKRDGDERKLDHVPVVLVNGDEVDDFSTLSERVAAERKSGGKH